MSKASQNMAAVPRLSLSLCVCVNAGQTTSKQMSNSKTNKKKHLFKQIMHKEKSPQDKTKTEHNESLYRALKMLSLSVCLSSVFPEGVHDSGESAFSVCCSVCRPGISVAAEASSSSEAAKRRRWLSSR